MCVCVCVGGGGGGGGDGNFLFCTYMKPKLFSPLKAVVRIEKN